MFKKTSNILNIFNIKTITNSSNKNLLIKNLPSNLNFKKNTFFIKSIYNNINKTKILIKKTILTKPVINTLKKNSKKIKDHLDFIKNSKVISYPCDLSTSLNIFTTKALATLNEATTATALTVPSINLNTSIIDKIKSQKNIITLPVTDTATATPISKNTLFTNPININLDFVQVNLNFKEEFIDLIQDYVPRTSSLRNMHNFRFNSIILNYIYNSIYRYYLKFFKIFKKYGISINYRSFPFRNIFIFFKKFTIILLIYHILNFFAKKKLKQILIDGFLTVFTIILLFIQYLIDNFRDRGIFNITNKFLGILIKFFEAIIKFLKYLITLDFQTPTFNFVYDFLMNLDEHIHYSEYFLYNTFDELLEDLQAGFITVIKIFFITLIRIINYIFS